MKQKCQRCKKANGIRVRCKNCKKLVCNDCWSRVPNASCCDKCQHALAAVDLHIILAVEALKRAEYTDAFEQCSKAKVRINELLTDL
jgi:hypothetical protein